MENYKYNILQMMRFNGIECMDVADKEFDMSVTVDIPETILEYKTPKDEYESFMYNILTTIPVESVELGVANFYGFIEQYITNFRALSKWGEWDYIPEDNDDLIEMWIDELQGLCAGAGNNTIYKYLNEHWPTNNVTQDDSKYEEKVYEALCVYCENEKYCHENCEVCERFEDAVENLKEAQNA